MTDTDTQRDQLVERLFLAGLGMGEVLTVYLGDTLGLYRAIDRAGSVTPAELAKEAGIFERYAREWLEQQAAAGILSVEDAAAAADRARYVAPSRVMSSRCSTSTARTRWRRSASRSSRLPARCRSWSTRSAPEGWSRGAGYGRDVIEAQGDFNRPWLVGSLGTEYLPAIPDIHERLDDRRRREVADVACGVGWAAISLAKAYPNVTVDGFDLDEPSIEIASRNAQEAGVADRVHFEVRDAAEPSRRVGTTSRWWWRRSTTSRTPSRC